MRLRSLLLSLRLDGPAATAKQAWTRLFGEQQSYVFVRHLTPPPLPVAFPVERNGLVVRQMQPSDLRDLRVRRYEPAVPHTLSDGVVAVRDGRVVGAAWYTDSVNAQQPWYDVVRPHVVSPARFTANLFVVPGDKGAAWALAKAASDCLAVAGIRTIVGVIGVQNAPSILMSRLLGSKMVGRMLVRHRFGHTAVSVEALSEDRDAGIGSA